MMNAPNRARPTARRLGIAVLSIGGVAVVAACSSGTTGSSGSSASAPAASVSGIPASGPGSASASTLPCAQVTALRSTLTDISHLSVSPGSAPRLAADLARAEQLIGALKGQGGGQFSAQVTQLSNALNAIKADAAALAQSPTPTNIANLTKAVTTFKTTAQPLIKEMQTECPEA